MVLWGYQGYIAGHTIAKLAYNSFGVGFRGQADTVGILEILTVIDIGNTS